MFYSQEVGMSRVFRIEFFRCFFQLKFPSPADSVIISNDVLSCSPDLAIHLDRGLRLPLSLLRES